MLWVAVETVLRLMGHGRSGRPRSPEVAIRGMATERGQQVFAQASLHRLLDEKKSLEAERDKTLTGLDEKFKPEQLPLEEFVLKPRKMDIEVNRVSLVWLPDRVNTEGRALRHLQHWRRSGRAMVTKRWGRCHNAHSLEPAGCKPAAIV